jgi:hypothetical protein
MFPHRFKGGKMGVFGLIRVGLRQIMINLERFYLYHFRQWGVHTEVVFYDPAWEKVKLICKKRKMVWFVITPANYDYAKAFFNCEMSKDQFSKVLSKRYKEMEKMGQRIELHVHLSIEDNMLPAKQKKMIGEALAWVRSNGFDVKEFVPGWWSYNADMLKILDGLNLKAVRKTDYYAIHDYELIHGNEHLW